MKLFTIFAGIEVIKGHTIFCYQKIRKNCHMPIWRLGSAIKVHVCLSFIRQYSEHIVTSLLLNLSFYICSFGQLGVNDEKGLYFFLRYRSPGLIIILKYT